METKAKAPQLVWDRGVPIWRATRAAIKAGFPTRRANLKFFADNEAALFARCHRLTAEQNEWLSGRRSRDPLFDGTIGSVINFWQSEPTSPYHAIEASSRHPYDIYARIIIETVGARRVDALDGRDVRRWHDEWSAPLEEGKPRIAAARMAVIVLKNALTFAATCRKPGCAELRDILEQNSFCGTAPAHGSADRRRDCRGARSRAPDRPSRRRARLCAAIRRRDAPMGRGRQMGAARRQEAVVGHRRHLEMDRPDVVADR